MRTKMAPSDDSIFMAKLEKKNTILESSLNYEKVIVTIT